MSDRQDIQDVLDTINSTGFPVTVMADYLGETPPSASLQHLDGSRWAKRYVDGSGTREIPAMIWYRTSGDDTSSRLDANAAMRELADTLEALDGLPGDVTAIQASGTPVLAERDEGGEVWRMSLVVESHREAPRAQPSAS